MKYSLLLLFLLVFLQSCSNRLYLTNKTEYLQGKIIYEMIQPTGNYNTDYEVDILVLNTNSLDSCKQYLLSVYVLSKGLKYGAGSLTDFHNSFVSNLIDNLELYTSVFRGKFDGHQGIVYYSKNDVKKDLRDWRRILKCKQ